MLVVPVVTNGIVRAVLAGSIHHDRRQFSERDLRLAEAIADRASTALDNARLFEELTRAYQELKTAQEHLVQTEKLRALGEMASGVAHDFNNILAAILGRVQLILNHTEEPTLRRWLQVIERAALDGAQTVRQIQEFTRIRRDQPAETVDLAQVALDAVEMTQTRWRDEAQSQGLEVRVMTQLEPVSARGRPPGRAPPGPDEPDPQRGGRAAPGRDHHHRHPRRRRGRRGERRRHRRRDVGGGAAADLRAVLLDQGAEGHRPGPGHGLRHRRRATGARSSSPRGRATARRSPSGCRSAPAAPSRAPPRSRWRPTPGRGSWSIDDEEHVREALADMLRLTHHEVVVASQGFEGLEHFRAAPFDLVMTDLAMPGMSGWQVAQAVKALRPGVPVVLVTGWGVELPAEQLRANGVDRVMTKPFRIEEVHAVAASFLRRPVQRS